MKTVNSKREAASEFNGMQVTNVRPVEQGSPSFEGQDLQVVVTIPDGRDIQFYADEVVDTDAKPAAPAPKPAPPVA